MKKIKLYIPIHTGKDFKYDHFTMLDAYKVGIVAQLLPDEKTIYNWIVSQQEKVTKTNGYKFQPIQIKIESVLWEALKREIKQKVNSRLILDVPCVDVVFDSQVLPVIQFIP
jgi:hypothetical protein